MFTRTKQKIYALFIPSVQQSLGFSHSFLGSMANLGRIRTLTLSVRCKVKNTPYRID